jgi:replicative DNA helicase
MNNLDRLPPQSVESEQAFLAAIIMGGPRSKKILVQARGQGMEADDFYHRPHGRIWAAMVELHEVEGEQDADNAAGCTVQLLTSNSSTRLATTPPNTKSSSASQT